MVHVTQALITDFLRDRFRSIVVIFAACWAGHTYGGLAGLVLAPAAWVALLLVLTIVDLRRRKGRRRRRRSRSRRVL